MSLSNNDFKEQKKSNWGTYGDDILLDSISDSNTSSSININEERKYLRELSKGIADSINLQEHLISHINKTRIINMIIVFFLSLVTVAINNKSLSGFKIFILSVLVTIYFYFLSNLLVKPVINSKKDLETLILSRKLTQEHLTEAERYVNEIELLNKQIDVSLNVITYLNEYTQFLGGTPEKEEEFVNSDTEY